MWEDNLVLTPEEAAPILGMTPSQVRNLMKRDYIKKTNDLPIGKAFPATSGRSKQFRYRIYRPLLMKFVGLEEKSEEENAKV